MRAERAKLVKTEATAKLQDLTITINGKFGMTML
jgi:hypothetical protein